MESARNEVRSGAESELCAQFPMNNSHVGTVHYQERVWKVFGAVYIFRLVML